MNQEAMPHINRIQTVGLGAAAVGIIGLLVVLLSGAEQFFQAYLIAFLFWVGLSLGSLIWLIIHHLAGGRWGFSVRRFLEAGAMTTPLLLLLFLPIFLGLGYIYPWADPAFDAHGGMKEFYLTEGAFFMRTIIYFAIWGGLAFLLYSWSGEQDEAEDGDFRPAVKMRYLSGAGILLYVITMTLASVDWGMSIVPEFFSTMYGVIFMVGQGLSTMAFLVIMLALFYQVKPVSDVVDPDRVHDVGKLMFSFGILWAYVSYGQYVIIWSGNLPELTPWYINRSEAGWSAVAILLMVGHFALPFFILLSRPIKRRIGTLAVIAVWVLVMRLVDLFWIIAPDFADNVEFTLILPYIVALVGLGGIWLTGFAWLLKRRSLVPQNDLRNDPRALKGQSHA